MAVEDDDDDDDEDSGAKPKYKNGKLCIEAPIDVGTEYLLDEIDRQTRALQSQIDAERETDEDDRLDDYLEDEGHGKLGTSKVTEVRNSCKIFGRILAIIFGEFTMRKQAKQKRSSEKMNIIVDTIRAYLNKSSAKMKLLVDVTSLRFIVNDKSTFGRFMMSEMDRWIISESKHAMATKGHGRSKRKAMTTGLFNVSKVSLYDDVIDMENRIKEFLKDDRESPEYVLGL